MTDAQFAAADARAQARAFHVAGVTQLRVVDQVMKALEKAIADGTTLAQFKKQVADDLLGEWKDKVANPSARMEAIFRTNLQGAYSAGRFHEMMEPDAVAVRPFWKFSAVMDGRTSFTCFSCNGVISPVNSGWWASHIPPLHIMCRSAIVPITSREAKTLGHVPPPDVHPPPGFGTLADARGDNPIDISNVSEVLRAEFKAKEPLAHRRRKSK